MRVFSLTMLILGGFIGAGFASGREVANYFSRFQEYSILAIVVAVIILFFLVYLFLILSDRFNGYIGFINQYFGRLGGLVNFLFAVSLLIIIASMFAGCGVVAESYNLNENFVIILTAILAFFSCAKDVKLIDKINRILVPFIMLIIVFVCLGFNTKNYGSNNSIFYSIFSGANYIFINIVTLGLFILEIGKNYTKKDKIVASLLVSAIIGIILFVFNNAIIYNDLVFGIMPTITLSKMKGNFVYFLTIISIWLALFTTLVSNLYILCTYTSKFIKNKYVNLAVMIGVGVIVSFFGFDTMVNYIYSFIGAVGIIVIVNIIVQEKRRKIFSSLE